MTRSIIATGRGASQIARERKARMTAAVDPWMSALKPGSLPDSSGVVYKNFTAWLIWRSEDGVRSQV